MSPFTTVLKCPHDERRNTSNEGEEEMQMEGKTTSSREDIGKAI